MCVNQPVMRGFKGYLGAQPSNWLAWLMKDSAQVQTKACLTQLQSHFTSCFIIFVFAWFSDQYLLTIYSAASFYEQLAEHSLIYFLFHIPAHMFSTSDKLQRGDKSWRQIEKANWNPKDVISSVKHLLAVQRWTESQIFIVGGSWFQWSKMSVSQNQAHNWSLLKFWVILVGTTPCTCFIQLGRNVG